MVQWEEEVGILQREIERIFHFFSRFCGVWREMAMSNDKPGFSAYAHETADVYAQRALHCKHSFEKVVTSQQMNGLTMLPPVRLQSDYDLSL